MKILVVSLLRLGDFIMMGPVLAGLKNKYPAARLDVWCHTSVARGMKPLLPQVEKWWTVDREALQRGLGDPSLPLLTSFDVLREQSRAISDERYDLVVNLTQSKFSGYLMGYIFAKEKMGLTIDAAGRAHFLSPWFRYLNERADRATDDIFHYIDIFSYGADVGEGERHWPFQETAAGSAMAQSLGFKKGPRLVVQALTSDKKKNFGTARWRRFLSAIEKQAPEVEIFLLGAPGEETELEAIGLGAKARVTILNLEAAYSLLRQSDLLITGDTSIKHLANSTRTKIVELSIGSSDSRRTGAYKEGSFIVQGSVPCAPCPHSAPCPHTDHLCAQAVEPERVADLAVDILQGKPPRTTGLSVRQTRFSPNGYWYTENVSGGSGEDLFNDLLRRSTWKLVLQSQDGEALPKIGSEAYAIEQALLPEAKAFGHGALLGHLDFLESEIPMSLSAPVEQRPSRDIVNIGPLRRQKNQQDLERRLSEVRRRLIRTMRSSLREKTE